MKVCFVPVIDGSEEKNSAPLTFIFVLVFDLLNWPRPNAYAKHAAFFASSSFLSRSSAIVKFKIPSCVH